MKESNTKLFYLFITGLISAIVIFSSLYNLNNKYTYNSFQPEKGYLDLSEFTMDEKSLMFLVNGWEFYPNVLLTPEDFNNGVIDDMQPEYIDIVEEIPDSEIRTGTYHLQIDAGDEIKEYTICMPEIFSAYKLYINNMQRISLGDIYGKKNEIQNRSVNFYGNGKIDLLILVRSSENLRNGIVYPPTYGSQMKINKIRGMNVLIAALIMASAMILFWLILWFSIRDKISYAKWICVFCVFLIIYIAHYPIHYLVTSTGCLSYAIETGVGYGITACIITINNYFCDIDGAMKKISQIVSWFVTILSAIVVMFAYHVIEFKAIITSMILGYSILCIIYLGAINYYAIKKRKNHISTITFITIYMCMALLFKIILPNYEPIMVGRYCEIAWVTILGAYAYIIILDVISDYSKKVMLYEQRRQIEKQVLIQREHYSGLSEAIEETRKQRHDMRQHIRVIKEFSNNNNVEKIKEYLMELDKSISEIQQTKSCGNTLIDALLQYYSSACDKNNIVLDIDFHAKRDLKIRDTDLSIIIGNLIENAIEGSTKINYNNRKISFHGICNDTSMKIKITNSYDGKYKVEGDVFMSRKRDESGIGLLSIKEVVKKYGGIINIEPGTKEFTVMIMIPFE